MSLVHNSTSHKLRLQIHLVAAAVVVTISALSLVPISNANAATPIGLGTADSFAVLAGAGITNSGSTVINGDIGTFPTPAITGYGSITHTGTNHADDGVTQGAKNDLVTAYNQAAGSGPPTSVATELGGSTLTPGVYTNGTLGITGTLTLDTQGDPQAVFVFQASTTLITAVDSNVVFLNGATSCNVYWQVGSSTTLGGNSHIEGNILNAMSISLGTGATVHGRLLALDGAVTLLTNTITNSGCQTTATTTTTSPVGTTSTTSAATTTTPATTTTTASATDSSGTTPSSGSAIKKSSGKASGSASSYSTGLTSLAYTGFSGRLLAILGSLSLMFGILVIAINKKTKSTNIS